MQYPQIFRSSSGALVRPLRSAKAPFVAVGEEANAGGAVPPGGPLTRLLSVMVVFFSVVAHHCAIRSVTSKRREIIYMTLDFGPVPH